VHASEVRREIAAQHAALRELLAEIDALVREFERAGEGAHDLGRRLHDRGFALYERFRAHLGSEQTLLEPALQRAGEAGRKLARRLANEHHEQRELLKYLVARLEQHPDPTLTMVRELEHFARFLRFEMEQEEESMLAPGLLEGGEGG
jgi:iron-sulfur cluster repair protein YtfE (RIC family)